MPGPSEIDEYTMRVKIGSFLGLEKNIITCC